MARPRKRIDPRASELAKAYGRDLQAEVKVAAKREPSDKHAAGSLRWLEARAAASRGVMLPPTSVWRIFNGETTQPDWLLIEQVLTVAGVSRQDIDGQWHARWVGLMRAIHNLERLTPAPPPPALVECPICGAGMMNERRHLDHHAEYDVKRKRPLRLLGIARAS